MKRNLSTGGARLFGAALCLGAASLLAACASDPGEKVVDTPFPDLAEVPPRPQASTTADERAAVRRQLESRRDEINRTAESLLRGGTGQVPVALDAQVPGAPQASTIPPPPLPEGLPAPPERPRVMPGAEASGAAAKPAKAKAVEAPEAAQMPPARAPGEKEEEDTAEEGEGGA